MAATRLRKTFHYPDSSDDEDTVEAGMDLEGTSHPSLPLQSSLLLSLSMTQLTFLSRPRNPPHQPTKPRHNLNAPVHTSPPHTTGQHRHPYSSGAPTHIFAATESARTRQPGRQRIRAILPPPTTARHSQRQAGARRRASAGFEDKRPGRRKGCPLVERRDASFTGALHRLCKWGGVRGSCFAGAVAGEGVARGDDGGGRVLARVSAERCAVGAEGVKGR